MFTHSRVKICMATLAMLLFSALPAYSASAPLVNSAALVRYQVVDLDANFSDEGQVVDVSGGVKNFGFSAIRGNVIIYLLDANQTVINGVEVAVNNLHSFDHGQVGKFEAVLGGAGNNVSSVAVEFVKK